MTSSEAVPAADPIFGSTLLVVDDEEPNVRLLERILSAAGFTNVHSEMDPRRVPKLLTELRPDAILLDLLMPSMDGFRIMEQIASTGGGADFVPVLVLTADLTLEARDRALRAGASDFLTKPFDATEVTLRLTNLLHTRLLHQQVQEYAGSLEELVSQRTRELTKSYQALKKSDVTRRELLRQLVNAQEAERSRIAGDVHDDPIQQMTAVGMRLEILRSRLSDPGQLELVGKLITTVQGSVARLRNLLFQLRPPSLDRQGLASALRDLLRIDAETSGFRFDLDDRLDGEPPDEARTILYRIAQEAVTNARKHAQAKNLSVKLAEADDGYLVTVRDDGRGFDAANAAQPMTGHLGLVGMSERAALAGGNVKIESSPGTGTTVRAWIPMTRS